MKLSAQLVLWSALTLALLLTFGLVAIIFTFLGEVFFWPVNKANTKMRATHAAFMFWKAEAKRNEQ